MNDTNKRPLHDLVMLRVTRNTQTRGGIDVPEMYRKADVALAIAVGPECKYVKEGDLCIVLGKATTYEVPDAAETCCVYERDILMVEAPQ